MMTYERSAGILMHITSLPSPFGIGDMGPEAYRFADFLHKAGQTWWQVLPTNQVGSDSNYSPYSGLSAFAGNILLISPRLLEQDGLLSASDIDQAGLADLESFAEVERHKKKLFTIAFDNWESKGGAEHQEFTRFSSDNHYWLEDYALYTALRDEYGNKWKEWPDVLKMRQSAAIAEAKRTYEQAIKRESFFQFVFYSQWKALQAYCHNKQVRFFGDMPIYVDHLSCDVWSHRDIFKLDREGEMITVAGVPPDYFSENGQLWNMPVYDWPQQKERGYDWWVRRIKHNLQSYDIVRLDHFRGFVDYWEVARGEETAKNGKWTRGPREFLFDKIKEAFPNMPIIAEDLGEIDQPVYDLMDTYELPGMRVLQFAWGDNLGENPHIIHMHRKNMVAYTGTHDNIPVQAWYSKTDDGIRDLINTYVGHKVTTDTINEHFIHLVWQSVADISITTTQDLLGLGEEGTMNIPGEAKGNWTWRMEEGVLTDKLAERLQELTKVTGRLPPKR
ncbi:MAG: 4-alpha-glucanotransferase [Cyclobacteriaceae bacterium]